MKKYSFRFISFVLSLAMVICVFPVNAFALEFVNRETLKTKTVYDATLSVGTYDDLVSAINAANSADGNTLINITNDITVTAAFPAIKRKITLNGANHTLLRDNAYTGGFFTVNSEATLTLGGGLIIDGNNEWMMNEKLYAEKMALHMENEIINDIGVFDLAVPEDGAPIATEALFKVNGNVVANDVTVKNHVGKHSGALGYGIFRMASASELVINDGANFIHNATSGGATICYLGATDAVVIMNGGLIDGNFFSDKGGVFKLEHGYFELNGGTISNNRGMASDGTAVFIRGNYHPKFVMNGGTICGNASLQSGQGNDNSAINLSSGNGIVEIHGGKIYHNIGRRGGGIAVRDSAEVKCTITGGEIVNNVAVSITPSGPSSAMPAEDMKDFVCGGIDKNNISIVGGVFSQNLFQEPDLFKECLKDTVSGSETYGQQYGFEVIFRTENGEEVPYFKVVPAVAKNERTGETFGHLQDAIDLSEDGDVITLLCNQEVVYNPLFVTKNLTFDMNGYTVYGSKYTGYYEQNDGSYKTQIYPIDPMVISESENVTFKNGTMDALTINHTGGTIFYAGEPRSGAVGNITIENGIYIANTNIATAIYGNLEVKDGYFDIKRVQQGTYGFDCNNTTYKKGQSDIEIFGGTFKNFNPQDNNAEGAGTDFCVSDAVTAQLSNGMWMVGNNVCRNTKTGAHYQTVSEGLSKALDGQTIQLISSTTDGELLLPAGATLDLNGFTLIASSVVGGASTNVIDSTNNAENGYEANGLLKINGEQFVLSGNNSAVPVYSPIDGGYIFVDFLFNQGHNTANGVSTVNALVTTKTMKVISLLKDGAADNDIQIGVRVTVNGNDPKTFVFSESAVKNVMNSNGGKFNLFDRMFYASFTGLDSFETVEVHPVVIAHGNVIDMRDDAIILK